MKKVFMPGGASYNSIITLETFPGDQPQTIHECDYTETIGNTGAGKALAMAKLGFDTVLHTLIGEDQYGAYVLKHLEHENLLVLSDLDPKGTERHLNILNALGQRISIFTNPSSDEPDINYEAYSSYLEQADYVVINISNYCRNFIPIAKKLNKAIWTDLHDYDGESNYHDDFIEASDYIFLSSDNLSDYRSVMQNLIQSKHKKLVVCTHGAEGSHALTDNGEWIHEPALLDFEYKNCNGAGDSFFSGFLFAHSKGLDVALAMKYATIAGALTINSNELVNAHLSADVLNKSVHKLYNINGFK